MRKEVLDFVRGDQRLIIEFYAHDGGIHIRFGIESGGGDDHGNLGVAVNPNAQCQQGKLSRSGGDAFRHFFLHRQRQTFRTGFSLKQMTDHSGGDVIGNIGGDIVFAVREVRIGLEFQDIAFDNLDISAGGQFFPQQGNQVFIQLHSDNPRGAFGEVAGQCAEPGTNLQHGSSGGNPRGVGDAREDFIVGKEVLPKPLMRLEVVFVQQAFR